MNASEEHLNGLLSWQAAIAALRMRSVVDGDVPARDDEPIDIIILAALREAV